MKRGTRIRNSESEFETFLKQWKEQRPDVEKRQREGRLLRWDKGPLAPHEVRRAITPEVKLKPCVYD